MQDTDESPLSPRQRVIDEGVVAGNINLELSDDGATGWDDMIKGPISFDTGWPPRC